MQIEIKGFTNHAIYRLIERTNPGFFKKSKEHFEQAGVRFNEKNFANYIRLTFHSKAMEDVIKKLNFELFVHPMAAPKFDSINQHQPTNYYLFGAYYSHFVLVVRDGIVLTILPYYKNDFSRKQKQGAEALDSRPIMKYDF